MSRPSCNEVYPLETVSKLPKVSVIVPVFNGEQTIQPSLNSLFLQTLNDIEVIAVDDASNDRSPQILDRIARDEPRFRVIHLPENVGAHEARVAGLRLAKAPHIGFLDADDFVKPDMFRRMLEACVHHDADIAVCGMSLCSQDRKIMGVKQVFDKDETEHLEIFERFCRIEYGTGSLCNKLYKRDLLLKHALVNFRWRQDASEDTLVNIGCFYDAKRVRLVREKLYEYTVNPFSATRSADRALCFTRMFRGYAIAVDLYRGYGSEVLGQITELYAKQLRYSSYRIEEQSELAIHEQSLKEAISLVSEKYPIGLAFMTNYEWLNKYNTTSLSECIKLIAQNIKVAPRLIIKAIAQRIQ